MADKSKIEWTDMTWNPVTGCTKVSQGCKHCYAERDWRRLSANPSTPAYFGRDFTEVKCHPERLDIPLRLKKPRRIFVNSMSDLFHESVPDDFILSVFVSMAVAQQHTYQVLTKRARRMRKLMTAWKKAGLLLREGCGAELRNVHLGVSVEDQAAANERIPELLETPAAVRWVSIEPMLGPVDLRHISLPEDDGSDVGGWPHCDAVSMWLDSMTGEVCSAERHGDELRGVEQSFGMARLDWVVVGGESGPNARPMHPAWSRSLRDQCAEAGVPFLFKQWGEFLPTERDGDKIILRLPIDSPHGPKQPEFHEWKDGAVAARVGKKAAGRLLDGMRHDGYPIKEAERGE